MAAMSPMTILYMTNTDPANLLGAVDLSADTIEAGKVITFSIEVTPVYADGMNEVSGEGYSRGGPSHEATRTEGDLMSVDWSASVLLGLNGPAPAPAPAPIGNLFGIPIIANPHLSPGTAIIVPQPSFMDVARKLSESLARKYEHDLMNEFLLGSFAVKAPAPLTMTDIREEMKRIETPRMTRPEPKLI